MTPERLLADTDIVIDLLKKKPTLAAIAQAHRCPLWTGNRKHYPMDDIELFAL